MRANGYVIHTRPFQDNKVLVDLLTQEQGLMRGVWRLPKKEARVLPGPFLCYEMDYVGRSDLKTIKSLESLSAPSPLDGLNLYAALYVHELLEKLLPTNLPLPDMYALYQWLIESLYAGAPVAPLLRRFEVGLFADLGSSISMGVTGRGEPLKATQMYQFHGQFGLRPYHGEILKQTPIVFVEGQVAMQYHAGVWRDKQVLSLAKVLHRHWLDGLLNGKPVVSRELLPTTSFRGELHLGVPVFRAL
ncbi:DNA repair protein RecO [Marinomonas posidonica]|uniref:DNA repair protein RecO n=1 Tax=Marinomonas posidonica (strain CECT 7376 / NCIMB 14433 / IVIA-Po-181) TaxID=491952 RepID=F6CY55_MARPP|nr:DNA repair protein RecO [Marinomonas posidonica]AEF55687.1 DNA repair protein RecO [Marinomonas posidonica IVIA-Po-181]